MRYSTWALALSMATALGGIAVAQPLPPQPQPDPNAPNPLDPMQPPPQPPQPPPQQQPPPPPPPPPEAAPTTGRPEGISFGIGAGYEFPTPLEMMNTFSARLRLASAIILEPRVVIRNESTSDDTTGSTQRFKFAMGFRAPLITRGKFDFELLGDGTITSVKTPIGADESSRLTTLALSWGIGISWWLTPHFAISTAATNPLVNFTRGSNSVDDMTTSTTDIGLIFDPRISVMIHIYN